jgi:hypothetical protein
MADVVCVRPWSVIPVGLGVRVISVIPERLGVRVVFLTPVDLEVREGLWLTADVVCVGPWSVIPVGLGELGVCVTPVRLGELDVCVTPERLGELSDCVTPVRLGELGVFLAPVGLEVREGMLLMEDAVLVGGNLWSETNGFSGLVDDFFFLPPSLLLPLADLMAMGPILAWLDRV